MRTQEPEIPCLNCKELLKRALPSKGISLWGLPSKGISCGGGGGDDGDDGDGRTIVSYLGMSLS